MVYLAGNRKTWVRADSSSPGMAVTIGGMVDPSTGVIAAVMASSGGKVAEQVVAPAEIFDSNQQVRVC
jgi:hypothetical protein